MRNRLFTAALLATLACSGAAIAQMPADPAAAAMPAASATAMPTAMTTEQKAAYDGWMPEQRTMYDGWPADVGTYYWTLTPAQQKGWWALSPEQRTQVYAMAPEARTSAWASIEGQLSGQAPAATVPEVVQTQANPRGEGPASPVPPNPETASAAVPPAMPADPGYQAGPYKGALTSPPMEAMNKAYPLCTRQLQDSCVNPGEAGSGQRRSRSMRKRG